MGNVDSFGMSIHILLCFQKQTKLWFIDFMKWNIGILEYFLFIYIDQYKSLKNDDFLENVVSQIFDVDVLIVLFSTNHPFMIWKT